MKPVIETTAPISIDLLKLYFEDKETKFIINYKDSNLKGEKLITYLSNLDIPCDLNITEPDDLVEMVGVYLNSTSLVNISLLEEVIINLLMQKRGIIPVVDSDVLEQYSKELDVWEQRVDSLTLYNIHSIQDETLKEFSENAPVAEDDGDMKGVNFVSLLKRDSLYSLLEKTEPDNLRYYPKFFNEYIFKGKNLFSYWANRNNPMFILTHSMASGSLDIEDYHKMFDRLQELKA